MKDKGFVAILILLILAIVILGGVFFYAKNNIQPEVVQFQPTPAPSQITTQVVTINTGLDLSLPTQNTPYNLKTANGHSLIYIYSTHTLYYDNQQIYKGNDLLEINLSDNGLHYIYTLKGGSNLVDIYIDNKKIKGLVNVTLPVIANDGLTFFYVRPNTNNKGYVISKNDDLIYQTPNQITVLEITPDGNSFLAQIINRSNNPLFELVKDGQVVYSGKVDLGDYEWSMNGQNLGYIVIPEDISKPQVLMVNGQNKLESQALVALTINNKGDYGISDSANKRYFINNVYYPIPDGFEVAKVYLNEIGDHNVVQIVNKVDGWLLDNKPFSQAYGANSVEFYGDKLFIYQLTK